MKIFSVLFVLVLIDMCFGRSMEPATIKKRFREAKYAFKFRVLSKSIEECFPGSATVKTPGTTTATTTATTTTIPWTTTASTADTTHEPTDRYTTDLAETTKATTATSTTTMSSSDETSQMPSTDMPTMVTTGSNSVQNSFSTHENPSKETTSTKSLGKSTATDSKGKEDTLKATTISSIEQPKTTTNILSQTSQKHSAMSSTAYSTNSVSPTLLESNFVRLKPLDNTENMVNTSESVEPGRRKRSCDILVHHQDIRIGRKHIYKGCDEINKMKRVKGMDKKYLKSTIRLQLGFSEPKGLKPNRNYFFMGRAVPGQHPADYVFMADELTVVTWKPNALKLKNYLRSNGGKCN